MKEEDAIICLKAMRDNLHETGKDYPYRDDMIPLMKESCDIAIKALEKGPCEDAVSRKAVVEYIKASDAELGHNSENELVVGDILTMPSVKPVACIATVKFSKEDMQELVNEKMKEFDGRCKECGKTAITRAENDEILNEAWRLLMSVTEEDGVTPEEANGMLKLMTFFFYKYHGLKKKPEWVENVEARIKAREEVLDGTHKQTAEALANMAKNEEQEEENDANI